jgi:hypothetical protein
MENIKEPFENASQPSTPRGSDYEFHSVCSSPRSTDFFSPPSSPHACSSAASSPSVCHHFSSPESTTTVATDISSPTERHCRGALLSDEVLAVIPQVPAQATLSILQPEKSNSRRTSLMLADEGESKAPLPSFETSVPAKESPESTESKDLARRQRYVRLGYLPGPTKPFSYAEPYVPEDNLSPDHYRLEDVDMDDLPLMLDCVKDVVRVWFFKEREYWYPPCLQCVLKGLHCDPGAPSCKRCIRTGCGEDCLAQRHIWHGEDGYGWLQWPVTLIRWPGDSDEKWERKCDIEESVSVFVHLLSYFSYC